MIRYVTIIQKKHIIFHYLLRKFQIKDTDIGDGYEENEKEKVMIYCCEFAVMVCLSSAFFGVIKHHDQQKLGEERVCLFTSLTLPPRSPSPREVRVETQSSNLEAGTDAECCSPCCSPWLFTLFLYSAYYHQPRVSHNSQ